MEDFADNIILIVEEEQLVCSKSVLLNNSEYFRVLLEGNFREKNTRYVTLQEVEAKSMRDLLRLLSDRSYFESCDDIYGVLSICSMLLFDELKMYIISELDRGLSPHNCLEVWSVMEKLHIKGLHCKAKCLSLLSFDEIKQNGSIISLSLSEVCNYLGHVNLQYDEEIGIFKCAMHWYRENHKSGNIEDNAMTLIRLIKCIAFKNASLSEILEMAKCEEIRKYPQILGILKNIYDMKYGLNKYEDLETYRMACRFLNSNIRYMPKAPALLVQVSRISETDENKIEGDETDENKMDDEQIDDEQIDDEQIDDEQIDDEQIDENESSEDETEESMSDEFESDEQETHEYECDDNKVRSRYSYFDVYFYGIVPPVPKTLGKLKIPAEGLTGYVVHSYMSKIYVFGGEYSLGRGVWNEEVLSLDIVTGEISKMEIIPSPRRHFESCVCGEYCFIVGGTGTFRLNQDNMFWYNFKKDTWSEQIELPCSGRQLKCCSIKKYLLIISFNNKRGYIYKGEDGYHEVLLIEDPMKLIPVVFDHLHLFHYNDKIYLKGDDLIEMEIVGETLKVLGICLNLKFKSAKPTNAVVCHNIVYTLYTHERGGRISLESVNLDTKEVKFIFESKTVKSFSRIGNVKNIPKLFAMYHYELVAHNTVNSW